MPSEGTGRERDLVLAPGQYVLILNKMKGEVNVFVGPHKTTMDTTDEPVEYNPTTRRYEPSNNLEQAIKEFPFAGEGSYIVLENPAAGDKEHPGNGPNSAVNLAAGRKVNIPGPIFRPLWPGQSAQTIEGHRLRSNNYLQVRVYNEEAAQENWGQAVMKQASPEAAKPEGTESEGEEPSVTGEGTVGVKETPTLSLPDDDLTIGQLMHIKGTDVSFFMPPTGIEVVPDSRGNFVREAVTLERLEYCILISEGGAKRYEYGPAVVFPEPTETFVEKGGERKFKAVELDADMGIHVKVIADYTEDGKDYGLGDELFITGEATKIYYPREEHSVIKTGGRAIHYAVTIPKGEARYVLDKTRGEVKLVRGPKQFLPDPRKEQVIQRVLNDKTVALWFPNNAEAIEHNRRLAALGQAPGEYGDDGGLESSSRRMPRSALKAAASSQVLAVDEFSRSGTQAPPPAVTLNTKYAGAVAIDVWTNWAVKVVSKEGESRTVVGPKTVLMEYDESLEVLALSTGKPKNTDRLERTVYLKVSQNQVTDILTVRTSDEVDVELKLSYRVDFEEDESRWFNIENYVKYLCDHMRSVLRHVAKLHGIEEFQKNCIPIIRDVILGTKKEDGSERPGMPFPENGMRVYEVEVLGVKVGDSHIDEMLRRAQHEAVQQTIDLATQQRRLEATKRREAINQEIAEVEAETAKRRNELEAVRLEQELELALSRFEADVKKQEAKLAVTSAEQEILKDVNEAELARERAKREQEIGLANQQLSQRLTELKAEVEAVVEKAKAISPDLVAALQAFGDQHIAVNATKAMAPMSLLGGNSVAEVLSNVFKGTMLERALQDGGNGKLPGTHAAPAETGTERSSTDR